jgi:hypothetical protein
MLAASLVDRSLILAGRRENSIRIISTKEFERDTANRRENLVLLCSPHRNAVTKEVLEDLDRNHHLTYPFKKLSNTGHFHLTLGGRQFFSESYKQGEDFKKEHPGLNPYESPLLEDCALIARFCNPWNPNKKVMLLAGIRAFGTWGAAHALREECTKLDKENKRRDFSVVVKCALSEYRISECRIEKYVAM